MWTLKATISYFISVINFFIIARALFSWFSHDYSNPIYNFLYQITEPILSPFRLLQEKIGIRGMIDFSPILAIVSLDILANIILRLL
ncbi:YggT family protein [Paramaledivibacter caminithermalis]|jgi:YggT family protein|uniref:YggT family protein n=1 Tax=Paramaledivibacter caminithermalis (strain DSM 15212 / CIP 107654 / DViRD3) TaxID=1121301 RepID=A0A1M6S364_PARC5|nr:YggT family protein [Paramaledivibacter caminithermalis]SHK39183.1 YggT family protein [Paramaledivibacter caminithermalis DSM 15212]